MGKVWLAEGVHGIQISCKTFSNTLNIFFSLAKVRNNRQEFENSKIRKYSPLNFQRKQKLQFSIVLCNEKRREDRREECNFPL